MEAWIKKLDGTRENGVFCWVSNAFDDPEKADQKVRSFIISFNPNSRGGVFVEFGSCNFYRFAKPIYENAQV